VVGGVTYLDIVAVFDFGDWFATSVILAAVTASGATIWCALFRDEMTIFREITVEKGPSSLATFVHVIASQELLRRKLRYSASCKI